MAALWSVALNRKPSNKRGCVVVSTAASNSVVPNSILGTKDALHGCLLFFLSLPVLSVPSHAAGVGWCSTLKWGDCFLHNPTPSLTTIFFRHSWRYNVCNYERVVDKAEQKTKWTRQSFTARLSLDFCIVPLLTYPMMQSFSWEANWLAAS